VFNELCFNLESFNPAFAATLLMVRSFMHVRAKRPTAWHAEILDFAGLLLHGHMAACGLKSHTS
jgi:hypothetical protein